MTTSFVPLSPSTYHVTLSHCYNPLPVVNASISSASYIGQNPFPVSCQGNVTVEHSPGYDVTTGVDINPGARDSAEQSDLFDVASLTGNSYHDAHLSNSPKNDGCDVLTGYRQDIDTGSTRESQTNADFFTRMIETGSGKKKGGLYPLYCGVCRLKLNATRQAREHFQGRGHARRMRLCGHSLVEMSDEISERMPPRTHERRRLVCKQAHLKTSSMTSSCGVDIYCRLCSVAFNSERQAVEHYNGKSHSRRLRHGNSAQPINGRPSHICIVCGLSAESKSSLDDHIRTTGHTLIRALLSPANTRAPRAQRPRAQRDGTKNSLTSYSSANKVDRITACRLPSGQFYCAVCDVTIASRYLMNKHQIGRFHNDLQRRRLAIKDHTLS